MNNPEKLKAALLNEVWHRCGPDSKFDNETIYAVKTAHALLMRGHVDLAALAIGKTDLAVEIWEAALEAVEAEAQEQKA